MCGFLPWLLTPHIHVHSANPTSSVVSCLDLHRAGKRSLLVSWKAFWLERTSVYLFGHFATEHSSIKELLEPAGAPRNHQSSQTQCTAEQQPAAWGGGHCVVGRCPTSDQQSGLQLKLCAGALCAAVLFSGPRVFLFPFSPLLPTSLRFQLRAVLAHERLSVPIAVPIS